MTRSLLDPRMGFAEDILRLNGLVRLIEDLGSSESQSELRPFLSNEVQQRLQLWSEPTEEVVWPEILKRGEHIDLHHDMDVNTVFGIRISFPPDSEIGQNILAAAAEAGVYAPPINLDDILMQDEDYNTLFNNSLSISPLTSSALWGGEGL